MGQASASSLDIQPHQDCWGRDPGGPRGRAVQTHGPEWIHIVSLVGHAKTSWNDQVLP